MYVWTAGSYSGVTDRQQKAFGEAAKHAPADGRHVYVKMVRFRLSITSIVGYYESLWVWAGQLRDGKLEWSDNLNKAGD